MIPLSGQPWTIVTVASQVSGQQTLDKYFFGWCLGVGGVTGQDTAEVPPSCILDEAIFRFDWNLIFLMGSPMKNFPTLF